MSASLGISALYSHQAKALNAILAGKNVIIATPSASGKTLCYHLATLDALLHDKNSRALYIFPTKALAQDQLRSLKQIAHPLSLRAPTSRGKAIQNISEEKDGFDKILEEKIKKISEEAFLLTNPDML